MKVNEAQKMIFFGEMAGNGCMTRPQRIRETFSRRHQKGGDRKPSGHIRRSYPLKWMQDKEVGRESGRLGAPSFTRLSQKNPAKSRLQAGAPTVLSCTPAALKEILKIKLAPGRDSATFTAPLRKSQRLNGLRIRLRVKAGGHNST